MDSVGFDYEAGIKRLGQMDKVVARKNGTPFSLSDHLAGVALAVWAAGAKWEKTVQPHKQKLEAFFQELPPFSDIRPSLQDHCRKIGFNPRFPRTFDYIQTNYEMMKRIDAESPNGYDHWLTSKPAEHMAKVISKGFYKFAGIGPATAYEYFKNVGIDAIKPDTHIIRILGPERLGLVGQQSSAKMQSALVEVGKRIAQAAGINLTLLDNILWLFCADDCSEICTETGPRCGHCLLIDRCHYKKK